MENDKLMEENVRREVDILAQRLYPDVISLFFNANNYPMEDGSPDAIIINALAIPIVGLKLLFKLRWGECSFRTFVIHTQFHDFSYVLAFLPNTIERVVDFSKLRLSSGHSIEQLNKNTCYDDARLSMNVHSRLSSLLFELGIPGNLLGYKYLVTAILDTLDDINIVNRLTSKLYPTVAQRYNTTPQKVERSIRHAVMVACNSGKMNNINRLWNSDVAAEHYHPTNGELIAVIAEKILLELQQYNYPSSGGLNGNYSILAAQ